MRIKEVCERTGLTRRAVRFYEEKGLIAPDIDPKEHNDYRDYSEEDVKRLSLIARLRSLRIPVEEIARILREPGCSGEIFARQSALLGSEREEISDILDILIRTEGAGSLQQLSDRLERARTGASPDAAPDFARFEELTEEERAEFSDGGAVIDRIHQQKRLKALIFAAAAVILLITGVIFGVRAWKENQMLGISNAVGTNVQLLDLQVGEIGGEYHFYAVVKFEDPPECAGSDTMHLPMDTKRNTGGMVDALIVGETYSGMNIHGSVPRKVAKEYGLLNGQGYLDAGKTMELFYTDEVFAREYFGIDRFYSGSQIRPLDKVFAQDQASY